MDAYPHIGNAEAPRFGGTGTFPHDPGRPLRLAETRPVGDLVFGLCLTASSPSTASSTTPHPRKAST